ncbi:hypothetical protein MPSI1_003974 [Malassezia psittaci]|uniref:CAP-Gly domain-containing protein n=1 Tax=Malassezia psittaci TaxID=1821823 RepID=A0AAF0FIT3_9BASI|nr:hypothetical protein MPSI1_003974 [Malassezia psittaci]
MASVLVWVYAPSTQVLGQKSLSFTLSTTQLEDKLEKITGIPPTTQRVSIYTENDVQDGGQLGHAHLCAMPHCEPNDLPMEKWGIQDGMMLRVDDARGQVFGDEDAVEKYEMSDDAYASRPDSVRAFKQANKLGRFADDALRPDTLQYDPALKVGARCKIARDDQFERRGEIAYVGHTKIAPGIWVGVRYDEPVGKNDGQVQGVRYFDAKPKHGGIVRPAMVTAGDFPALNEWDSELDQEDPMEL